MKERSQELQQEVARLEGVVAAEKLSKEQCESEAAEQAREAKAVANTVMNGLREQLADMEAKLSEAEQHASKSNDALRSELEDVGKTEVLHISISRFASVFALHYVYTSPRSLASRDLQTEKLTLLAAERDEYVGLSTIVATTPQNAFASNHRLLYAYAQVTWAVAGYQKTGD